MKKMMFALILCCGCSTPVTLEESNSVSTPVINKSFVIESLLKANDFTNPRYRNVGEIQSGTMDGVDGVVFSVEVFVVSEWFPAEIFVSGDGSAYIRDAGTVEIVK